MSKVILKYQSNLEFSEKEDCVLQFDWNKCMGAYEFESINRPTPDGHIIDELFKYDGVKIPLTYHSKSKVYQIFVLDIIEVERYLKLKQLDI